MDGQTFKIWEIMNNITLMGRLTKDPETIQAGNTDLCKFSVATTEYFRDKDTNERKEVTQFHNVEAWAGLTKVMALMEKGNRVLITGKVIYNKYEKDGVNITAAIVRAERITSIDWKRKEEENESPI